MSINRPVCILADRKLVYRRIVWVPPTNLEREVPQLEVLGKDVKHANHL